jgi:hypothetical protein
VIAFQIGHRRPLKLRAHWRTGQSGAPRRPLELPCIARIFRGRPLALAIIGSPDSPVNFSHIAFLYSREQRVFRGWPTGQSGAPPDSPVNYSHTPPSNPESGEFTVDQPGAPDIVRCTTGQSGVPDRAEVWLHRAKYFPFPLFFFSHCF